MSGDSRNKSKSTIYVGGLADDVDESVLIEVFSTFGDIIDVQLPNTGAVNPSGFQAPVTQNNGPKHRGFAFLTFTTPIDAQDAIDNMDLNELKGKVLKVNIARPLKGGAIVPSGNRAIWESEEWLQEYGKKPVQAAYGDTSKRPDEIEEGTNDDDENQMEQ